MSEIRIKILDDEKVRVEILDSDNKILERIFTTRDRLLDLDLIDYENNLNITSWEFFLNPIKPDGVFLYCDCSHEWDDHLEEDGSCTKCTCEQYDGALPDKPGINGEA